MHMVYSSAGHWPALLRTAGGAITEVAASGLPLGARNLAAADRRAIALPPGSCLALYTDGLVEWARDVMGGVDALHRSFAAVAAHDDEHPARTLVERVLDGATARDDVAVLTVTVE
jgi:serine phosphatase RsbU (regulator of sigma subunit)